jgi:hypothetical protein
MSNPALEIPVRIAGDAALQQLKAINAAASAAGAAGKKAGDDASDGLGKADRGAKGLVNSLGEMLLAQVSLGTIKGTAQAIASEFDKTTDYIRQSAKEFQNLRKSMQEVATLKGSPNSNQFTLEEANKAQSFNLTPTEYRDFQAQFQNYAGSQIGDVKQGAKLTDAQGEEYAGRVAELMKASGVNPAVGAELAGSLLENAKGAQNVDALIKRLGTTFTVLEKGRVPLERALPDMSRIMGMGVEAEDAAKMYSIVSPSSAGEEGTAVRAALRAVQEMKTKGNGGDFGVQAGMSAMDSVRAFAGNVNQRMQKLMAGGNSEQKAKDLVMKQLADAGVANDSRELTGLVSGFGRQGVELGGFKRYDRIAANTPADFEAARKKKYEDSPQGRQDKVDAVDAVAQAEMGERNEKLEKRRQIAKVELTKSGAFERFGMDQVRGGISSTFGGADTRNILTNRQMLARARAEAGESGAGDNAVSLNNSATDAAMRGIMERIERNTRGALNAPPPGGAGKRQ